MNSLPKSLYDYIGLGVEHIADFEAYDHMLFLLALCAAFTLKDWKKALVLATAFTIGHTFMLIVAGLELIRFDSQVVEFLIPVTILLAAVRHWLPQRVEKKGKTFLLCVVFGFIHGMGFSSFIRMVSGKDGFVGNLLAFNIGVEIGQILIVLSLLIISTVVVNFVKLKQGHWAKSLSVIAIIISMMLIVQNWPF